MNNCLSVVGLENIGAQNLFTTPRTPLSKMYFNLTDFKFCKS